MHYSLGIDAGGTYTDAVIIRDSDGKVIDANKSLTTYPDLLTGIRNVLDALDKSKLDNVQFTSVSTTLATNSVLEGTGYPVALIIINETDIPNSAGIEHFIRVNGGHNSAGNEVCPLDVDSIQSFVLSMKNKVSAFAVSSYFSVRNSEHEVQTKQLITDLSGLPVVCSHELSQDLGAYERGVTAYLNARLIPVTKHFMDTVVGEIRRRNIESKVMMLKCDGSVVSIQEAVNKPIESIFSGPAASLVGASHLSGFESCAMIDVGGTSTDVSLMYKGLPELSESGAVVGGWATKVKAIKMETSAMGGDSHVWVKNHKINIGPRRVVPLCLASTIYPEIKGKLLKGQVILPNQIGENLQATKLFVRSGVQDVELTPNEQELFDRIGEVPLTVSEIYWDKDHFPNPGVLDRLITKRLIHAIGFTPTDALHVLGEYEQWDREVAMIAARILSDLAGEDEHVFCLSVKKKVALNMALDLVSFLLDDVDKQEIEKIIKGKFFARFKVEMPVVLLGGPVTAYVQELGELIDTEISVPEYANVGNALGAVMGKGVKRLEVLIKANYSESKYNLRSKSFVTFFPGGRNEFSSHHEALEFGERIGNKLVLDYMADSGLDGNDITIDMKRKDIHVQDVGVPLETRLSFLGIGESRKVLSK